MKKKIPTGIQEFKKLRDKDYYTIDKSMMIQEFLEIGSEVTLLTRPRRFGKSLNMSMMAEFFDITKDSTSLFQGLKIMDSEYACEILSDRVYICPECGNVIDRDKNAAINIRDYGYATFFS